MTSTIVASDLEYRLDVLTPTVVDAVRSVGGLLFDLARAGWNVRVLVRDQDDCLPLRVLGARRLNLDWTLGSMQEHPRPRGLVVATEVYESDEWVRAAVRDALAHAPTDVTFWGSGSTAELEPCLEAVRYLPSVAGKAFKSHALAGAGDDAETLRTVRRRLIRSRQPASPPEDVDGDSPRSDLQIVARSGRNLPDSTSHPIRPA